MAAFSPDRRVLLSALTLSACATASGTDISDALRDSTPDEIIPLWPGDAPGGDEVTVTEQVIERPNEEHLRDRIVTGVRRPTLSIFRPARPSGAALLVIPGGGYRHVVVDKEGYEAARWFTARGLTCFVLRYRLPGDHWAAGPDVSLQDAQRAMRVIRAGAAGYGVDPVRVASIGFSAGGHVAASLAVRFDLPLAPGADAIDALPAQPVVTCLMYPVITMGPAAHAGSRSYLLGERPTPEGVARYSLEDHARADMTPTMLMHAADDASVPLTNTTSMFEAIRAAGVKAELHVFEEGGHGFGLRFARGKPAAAWPELFSTWAQRHSAF